MKAIMSNLNATKNSTSESEFVCHGFLPLESGFAKAGISFAHIVTLSLLSAAAAAVRRRVDLNHPVFAVVFQELIIILFCELSAAVLLGITLLFWHSEALLALISACTTVGLQFHQLSWLFVTVLRCANFIF